MYNLQQTDFPNAPTATCVDIRSYASLRFNHDNNNSEASMPCDICGNKFNSVVIAALRKAPQFDMLQRHCPYWVTHYDITTTGFTFTDDKEELSYIAVPRINSLNPYSFMTNKSSMMIEANKELSEKLKINISSHTLYYNILQLNEKDEIIANNARNDNKDIYLSNKFKAFSINGARYSGAMSYIMRNYCRRYYFSMDECFKTIFLTLNRLCRFDGNVL